MCLLSEVKKKKIKLGECWFGEIVCFGVEAGNFREVDVSQGWGGGGGIGPFGPSSIYMLHLCT